jgi:hypothetical protein
MHLLTLALILIAMPLAAAEPRPKAWSGSAGNVAVRLADAGRPVGGILFAGKVYLDSDWRRVADRFNLLQFNYGPNWRDVRSTEDEEALLLKTIADAAAQLPGRPEITTAPIVFAGWSRVGRSAAVLSARPAFAGRVAAIVSYYMYSDGAMAPASGVPYLTLSAAAETDASSSLLSVSLPSEGAPEGGTTVIRDLIAARVAAGEPVTVISHTAHTHAALDRPIIWTLPVLWLEEVLAQRLPPAGSHAGPLPSWKGRPAWLGSFTVARGDGSAPWGVGERLTEVRTGQAAGWTGPASTWLPSERFARAWELASRTGMQPGEGAPVEVVLAMDGAGAPARAYAAIDASGRVVEVRMMDKGRDAARAASISATLPGGDGARFAVLINAVEGTPMPKAGPGVASVRIYPVPAGDPRIGTIAMIQVEQAGTGYPFHAAGMR